MRIVVLVVRSQPILTKIDNCGVILIERVSVSSVVILDNPPFIELPFEWMEVQLPIIHSLPIVHAAVRQRANTFLNGYVNVSNRCSFVRWDAAVDQC